MNFFKSFITGLQFLTCIRIYKECDWSPEGFGRSVKFFPFIGAVIGFFLACFNLMFSGYLPPHLLAALIAAAGIFLTGGLHCDGLMDTADGIFSGKTRERMLEIMKDSRVGANGVTAFAVVFILKYSIILDMPPAVLTAALFTMPVIGRLAMVMSIIYFPYARNDGMGRPFAKFADGKTSMVAVGLALLIILPFGKIAFLSLLGGLCCGYFLSRYCKKALGGLTGDVYGAVAESSEAAALFVFLVFSI